jgi:hypothetical protein
MLEAKTPHRRLILVCGLFLASTVGCGERPDPDRPYTTEQWAIVSNTGLHHTGIQVHSAAKNLDSLLPSVPDDQFRKLLKALMPFTVAAGKTADDEYDYALTYQAGMDPTWIYVDVREDDLRFWFKRREQVVYIGGKKGEFLSALPPPQVEPK